MDQDQFWQLIEASRDEDCQQHAQNLETELASLSAVEIIEFDQIFTAYFFAAYRTDLWAVATIINGGCSADGFMDFRNWLIAKGRHFYEAALQNPISAAEGIEPQMAPVGCEALGYVAQQCYERLTGIGLPSPDNTLWPDKPQGESWKVDDLPTLYPGLCRKFGRD